MQGTIGALRALTPSQLDTLRAAAPGVTIRHGAPPEQLLGPETEVLLTGQGDLPLAQATGLRWVQTEAAGVDHLVGTALWHSALTLTSANGAHTPQTSEFVLALLLSHAYKLPLAREYQAQALWGGGEHRERFTPRELRGQTLGIVGYGAIGREIARLAAALGMRIIATKRTADSSPRYTGYTAPGTGDPEGTLPEQFVTPELLPELLRQSDAIVLAVPLAATTRHMIGAAELALLRPDALLVNIGRGGLIDQVALLEALERGTLGGALLDVTEPEPLPPDHPLWRAPNTVITPHIAGLSARYADNVIAIFAENLRRYLAGAPLLNVVQRELGY